MTDTLNVRSTKKQLKPEPDLDSFSVADVYGYQRMMENGTTSVRVGKTLVHGISTRMGRCTRTATVSSQDTLSWVEDH